MPELARLKPAPIPEIRPIPEHAATGALAKTYARTKQGLGVPWMGVVAMAFAQYPKFYDTLWSAMEPMAQSHAFQHACSDLRICAQENAGALSPPSLLGQLETLGYSAQEIDDIRACNEIFSSGNMPYVLMASLARLLLEGHDWNGPNHVPTDPGPTSPAPKPTLIENHHADPTIAALYADIRSTLGLPFINTDYRAFARWPSYFVRAWADMRQAVTSDAYEGRVTRVHDKAIEIAHGLPNVTGLTPSCLRQAAAQDASLEDVLATVRLFQWLLPGLATNVAFLRAQLLPD
ncbi:MAG: hypothetical protein AAFO72_11145 [Pseudomonadota bacterium]